MFPSQRRRGGSYETVNKAQSGTCKCRVCSDDSEEAQSGDFRSEACRFFHIAVADTGIGIKGEDQERIFELVTQVDSSYSRQQQGTRVWDCL